MNGFNIDFYELNFLAEACIPPSPIARAYFWKKLTDEYWSQMTENQRLHMFSWLKRSWRYTESLETEEDTQIFNARFDPNNQYEVTTCFNDKTERHRAFLYKSKYHTGTTRFIAEDYITRITKIEKPDDQ